MVEDDADDWQIYGQLLCYNGYDVVGARDGELGYEAVRVHRPDVILLDIAMPRLDGLSMLERLVAEGIDRTPVVVLSALPAEQYEHRALQLGAIRYVEKPVSPVDVLHVIEDVTGRPPASGVGRPPQSFFSDELPHTDP